LLERLTYDRTAKAVSYRSDKSDGPTAGTETMDPLPGGHPKSPICGHLKLPQLA